MIKWNNNVFVDFEGVGMPSNGGRARAIGPEGFASLGRYCNKALPRALVGKPNNLGGRSGHRIVRFPNNVTDKHHFWKSTTLTLGAVTHSAQIALIEMLKTRQNCPIGPLIKVGLDVNNGRNRLLGVTKILKAYRACARRHAMQDPDRAGD